MRSLLTNGHVELHLKALLGVAWEGFDPNQNAYVMDKGFSTCRGARIMIDIAAFSRGKTRAAMSFWAEIKCNFREKDSDSHLEAKKALNQLSRYMCHGTLSSAPAYVIHFINTRPNPDDARYTEELQKKFWGKNIQRNLERWRQCGEWLDWKPVEVKRLQAYYKQQSRLLNLRVEWSESRVIWPPTNKNRLRKDPRVDAVIFKITRRNKKTCVGNL